MEPCRLSLCKTLDPIWEWTKWQDGYESFAVQQLLK